MFPDNLDVTVTLTAGTDPYVLPAGSVRSVHVSARPYGFDAKVGFVVSSEEVPDALFDPFSATSRIDAKITIIPRALDDPEDASNRAISFGGLVVDREVRETVSELEGEPIHERHYEVTIEDPLRALWSQHRPLELFAGASPAEVITQHVPPGVTLALDFTRLREKQDVLFVPLAADRPASFYDFVVGLLDETSGVLEHDATSGKYRIAKSKARVKEPVELTAEEVGTIRITAPEPNRATVHVLNPFADGHANKTFPNPNGVTGTRTDYVEYVMVPDPVDRRVETEKRRARPPEHGITVDLLRCPDRIPIPGMGVAFEEEVGETRYTAKKTYRVTELELHATGPVVDEGESVDLEDTNARFSIDLRIIAELASDPRPRLPRHEALGGPVYVEGRVLSSGGEDDDRTWFAGANEKNGISELSCTVPLWNKNIVMPFTPGREPGHFFFPPYKGQRVLIELHRDRARLDRFLDWAPNARTPMDAQGNRLALGYKDGNGTIVDHAYVDAKPVLKIERKLGGDEERIELRENVVFMDVQEKPTAAAVTPKYDVTPQVAAAKLKLMATVEGEIADVTAGFETSSGAVTASVEAASAEVGESLGAAEAQLTAKAVEVRAELETLSGALAEGPAEIAAAIGEAKAELNGALEG